MCFSIGAVAQSSFQYQEFDNLISNISNNRETSLIKFVGNNKWLADSYLQYVDPSDTNPSRVDFSTDPNDNSYKIAEFYIDSAFKTAQVANFSELDNKTHYKFNVKENFQLAGLEVGDGWCNGTNCWGDNKVTFEEVNEGYSTVRKWEFITKNSEYSIKASSKAQFKINAPNTELYVASPVSGFYAEDNGYIDILARKVVVSNSWPELCAGNPDEEECRHLNAGVMAVGGTVNIRVEESTKADSGVFVSNKGHKTYGVKVYVSGEVTISSPTVAIESETALYAAGVLEPTYPTLHHKASLNLVARRADIVGNVVSIGDSSINLNDQNSTYHIKGDLGAFSHIRSRDDTLILGCSTGGKITLAGQNSTLEGNAIANHGGSIDIQLNNGVWIGMGQNDTEPVTEDLYFDENWNVHKGDANLSTEGFINVTLNGANAIWNVTDNSQVTSITMKDQGLLNLAYEPTQKLTAPSYRKVTTKTFGGGNGIVGFRTNLDGGTDQLIITDKAEGAHQATIAMSGNADLDHSADWLIQQGGQASSMSFTNQKGKNEFSGRGMVTVWGLGFVPEGDENLLETEEGLKQIAANTTGTGVGNWYLIKQEYFEPDPGQPKPDQSLPDEIVENLSIGTSATQALAYQADLDDLRTRLGEVRYGAQDGAWVKAFTKKEKIGDGSALEQDVNGINVGLDTLVAAQEGSAWLVGGAFRYSNADQEGVALKHVSGELDEYSIKAYATWMHEQGSYADFVLQAGRYKQSLNGLDNTATGSSNAKYRTWGYGGSVEVGHMFSFANDADDSQWTDHWFVEPQLQLAYFHAKGADYHTSTGLKVDQGDADFLMGRAGVAIGKKFNFSDANSLDRRYFQVSAIGGVKHDFIGGDQTIRYTGVDKKTVSVKADELDDTRFYYGVNFDWQLANNWRVYGQVSREEGDQYTKDYDFSLGLKYAF